MRRLLMMFALAIFVAGTAMSAGCGDTEKPKTDKKAKAADKAGDAKKEDAGSTKKEDAGSGNASTTTGGDEIAMTNVSYDVTGMK